MARKRKRDPKKKKRRNFEEISGWRKRGANDTDAKAIIVRPSHPECDELFSLITRLWTNIYLKSVPLTLSLVCIQINRKGGGGRGRGRKERS